MRVVVVYESVFGNTADVAAAVADGVAQARPDAVVECLPVDAAGVPNADLLVVGGPTHFLGLTSERSRGMQESFQPAAAAQGRPPATTGTRDGVREWLDSLPAAVPGRRAAAFDTHLDKLLAGSAARRIAKRLRHKGYTLAAEPEGFVVEDMTGPSRAGELDRARAWGATLVEEPAALRSD